MSSASSARSALDGFVAGRTPAGRAVAAVAAAYYSLPVTTREPLREVVEIIERQAPGIVALARRDAGAGFAIEALERPFPAAGEAELRRAARALLATAWGVERAEPAPGQVPAPPPGWWARLVRAVRGLLSGGS